MPTVIEAKFGKQPCTDLSKQLRELADAVDRGEITDLVCSCVENGGYTFLTGASLESCLVLSTLLHERIIGRFKL